MNENYFRTLVVRRKDHSLFQEGRFENPQPIVDEVHDTTTDMVYLVDYKKRRYQEAQDGIAYSDWKLFEDWLAFGNHGLQDYFLSRS